MQRLNAFGDLTGWDYNKVQQTHPDQLFLTKSGNPVSTLGQKLLVIGVCLFLIDAASLLAGPWMPKITETGGAPIAIYSPNTQAVAEFHAVLP
jgi:hypothetical protein